VNEPITRTRIPRALLSATGAALIALPFAVPIKLAPMLVMLGAGLLVMAALFDWIEDVDVRLGMISFRIRRDRKPPPHADED
jgi:hypothetical protein